MSVTKSKWLVKNSTSSPHPAIIWNGCHKKNYGHNLKDFLNLRKFYKLRSILRGRVQKKYSKTFVNECYFNEERALLNHRRLDFSGEFTSFKHNDLKI